MKTPEPLPCSFLLKLHRRFAASTFVLLFAAAAPASAQPTTPVEVITDALEGNTGRSFGVGALHFGGSTAVIAVLKQQTTTMPLGTSSGGFTWEFDPSLGLVVRKSPSFGPIFSDRPVTIGRHKLSVGVTTQHTAWRSLGGQSLAEGEVYSSDSFMDDFYTDVEEMVFEKFGSVLDLRTDRTTINATFGLTNRVDLNVVIPFGRTSVTGGVDASYTIVSSGAVMRKDVASFDATGAGLADMSVKGKYQLTGGPMLTLAVAGELRLPTGDEEKLLGTGKLQEKVSLLASSSLGASGRYLTHVDVGYVFAGPGLRFDSRFSTPEVSTAASSDEIAYTAGLDAAIRPRITITGELVGRTLRNSATIVRTISSRQLMSSVGPFTREIISFQAVPRSLSILLGAVGAKVAVGSGWLLTGSVLFPLNDAGIRPGITPVIGFERAFF